MIWTADQTDNQKTEQTDSDRRAPAVADIVPHPRTHARLTRDVQCSGARARERTAAQTARPDEAESHGSARGSARPRRRGETTAAGVTERLHPLSTLSLYIV